jgi:hypothetical protein
VVRDEYYHHLNRVWEKKQREVAKLEALDTTVDALRERWKSLQPGRKIILIKLSNVILLNQSESDSFEAWPDGLRDGQGLSSMGRALAAVGQGRPIV